MDQSESQNKPESAKVEYSEEIFEFKNESDEELNVCNHKLCVLVIVKDEYEKTLEWLKKTQKLYNSSATRFVLIEGLCYLGELESLGVNYDSLPQIVYYYK